ncbi:MAG: class I SAM-dependent methyltransferase [Candidatus Omnitrophica bacterium]|nr:class I SAM-dependent methyltransferase [Candidatus Omnitrophota bacterium]
MSNKKIVEELDSSLYDKDFYFHCNDGFEEFKRGAQLSFVKNRALSLLEINKEIKFLDIGFGRGEILFHCAKLGAMCYGLDYSNDALSIAQELLMGCHVTLIQSDCSPLPFKDNTFDRILLGDVIEHLSFDKGVQLMKEIRRVLAPQGIFILHTTPNALFMKLVYPVLIHCLHNNIKREIINHVTIQNKVHLYEYHFFSLKRLAKISGMNAKVWIDDDITRAGTFRHLKKLNKKQKVLIFIVNVLKKLSPIKLLLGNDIWLKYVKNV